MEATVLYALALVRHPHLKSPFGQSKPRPLKGRRGSELTLESETLVAAVIF
jgi:hypothetical protein